MRHHFCMLARMFRGEPIFAPRRGPHPLIPLLLAAALSVALLALPLPALASAPTLNGALGNCAPNRDYGRPSSVCAVVYNDMLVFTSSPGRLIRPALRSFGITTTGGFLHAEGTQRNAGDPYLWADWRSRTGNFSAWVDAEWRVGIPDSSKSALRGQETRLRVHGSGDGEERRFIQCPNTAYIACSVAPSDSTDAPHNHHVFSVASLSTRPLVVRIVNQSGHTLERTSPSVLSDNTIRDEQIPDPRVIPTYDPVRPAANTGWYHFYRYPVRAKRASSLNVTYTLRSAQESNLNGAAIRIFLALDADGKDDDSRCVADNRFATFLQCGVSLTGSAAGVLTATVYVSQ